MEDSRWKPELKRGDLDLELHSTFPAGYQGDFGNGELKIAPIVVRSPMCAEDAGVGLDSHRASVEESRKPPGAPRAA